jgi:hypothetical protein
VLLRLEEKGFCMLCIYAKDSIIAVEEGQMEDSIKKHELVFNIKVQKKIETFVRCEIHEGIGEILLTHRIIVNKLLNSSAIEYENKFKPLQY